MRDRAAAPDPSWSARKFAVWWLRDKPFRPPEDGAIRHVGGFAGVTLFRDGPFQVQLFVARPHAVAVEHAHPDIDSLEVYIAGDGTFEARGNVVYFGMLCVAPDELHSAVSGPKGHAFFSIQKWLNGVAPSSVELDWAGEAVDHEHADALGYSPAPILAWRETPEVYGEMLDD